MCGKIVRAMHPVCRQRSISMPRFTPWLSSLRTWSRAAGFRLTYLSQQTRWKERRLKTRASRETPYAQRFRACYTRDAHRGLDISAIERCKNVLDMDTHLVAPYNGYPVSITTSSLHLICFRLQACRSFGAVGKCSIRQHLFVCWVPESRIF